MSQGTHKINQLTNKELINLSSGVAENMILDTIRLLNKSMNLLDIESDNKSAIFNIHNGFSKDLEDCRTILQSNVNISLSSKKHLETMLTQCNSRRLEYTRKFKR